MKQKTPVDATLPETETRTIHGLRHRQTGKLARVETEAVTEYGGYGDGEGSTTSLRHILTLDASHPVFDARSTMGLQEAYALSHGNEPHRPSFGEFRANDFEPVLLRETVTRSVDPIDVEFDIPIELDLVNVFDINVSFMKALPGLAEPVELVKAHDRELRDAIVGYGDEGQAWKGGRYHLVGMVVRDLPDEGVRPDARVTSPKGGMQRRAVAVVEIPRDDVDKWVTRRDQKTERAWVVLCLGDARRLPPSLVEALNAEASTAPRP